MDVSVKSGGAGALMKQLSLLTGSGSTPLVGELPGDAWLAYGAPNVGESLKAVYDAFAGALGGAAISGRLEQETGLDLQQDVFGWIGDVALFVRGADTAAIDGAVVIQATDPARARSAVTRMIGVATQKLPGAAPRAVELDGAEIAFAIAAPGTPKPVVVAVGGERVVVGYGQAAAEDALDPDAELGDAEPFKRATEALEEKSEPSFYVSMPEVMRLLEAMPDLAGDADFAKVKPYLDTIAAFIVGNQKDGERLRSRSAARLK
jgi:hypothetical protein